MARIIDAGAAGRTVGEQRALDRLELLPKTWFVVANKLLPAGRDQTHEIDAIVVGEHRVFVVDEKSWSGPILGSDQFWQLRGGLRPNPLNKIEYVVRQLATRLRDNVPGFPSSQARVVGARVLLSHETAKPQIHDPRAKEGVLTLENVVEQLLAQDSAAKNESNLLPLHSAIENVLYKIPARPKLPKEIGPYIIDELIMQRPGCRIFGAHHPQSGPRVLTVYDPPASETPQSQLSLVRRETDALRALQSSGAVPQISDSLLWEDHYEVVPVHVPSGHALGSLPLPNSPSEGVKEIRRIAAAFGALARVHAVEVVHRAISPEILIVVDEEIEL